MQHEPPNLPATPGTPFAPLTKLALTLVIGILSLLLVASFGALPVFIEMFADVGEPISNYTLLIGRFRLVYLALGTVTALFGSIAIYRGHIFKSPKLVVTTITIIQLFGLVSALAALYTPVSQLGHAQ